MGLKRKINSQIDDDFDILYLDEDNDDIEEWVDNDEDAEIDWVDDDDTQIGWLDDEDAKPVYKSQPKSKNTRSKKRNAKKTVSAAKGIFRVLQICAHFITLALIVLSMYEIGLNFWSNYTEFGNPKTIISDHNYTLAGFLAIGGCLLLYELIMFFWSLSKPRVGKHSDARRPDTGRGLFSFILLGVLVYLAANYTEYIPATHNALIGLKAGAILFGSLFNIILPICIAGLISCLIRKFTNRAHR